MEWLRQSRFSLSQLIKKSENLFRIFDWSSNHIVEFSSDDNNEEAY